MKKRSSWILIVFIACASAQLVWAAKKEIVTMVPEDLKWVEVPKSGGVLVANVSGDIMKGAYAAFAKIPAGQMHPLHTHSKDTKAVVVSGTFLLTAEDGVEKKIGPGGYFSVSGGLRHTSGCAAGAPCLLFQEGPGAFDMKPVEAKATEKK
jgi:quercetin dioxygenase-like cupin family protein